MAWDTRKRRQYCNLHPQQEAPEREVRNANMDHYFSLATFAAATPTEAASWGEQHPGLAAPGMGLAPCPLSPQPSALISQPQGAGAASWKSLGVALSPLPGGLHI